MTRNEVTRVLGDPSNLPKFGSGGSSVNADISYYHNESLAIRFNSEDAIIELSVRPERVAFCPDIFGDWPIRADMTLANWRQALRSYDIAFTESDPGSLNYWIVAADTCVAYGLPFANGRKLHGYDRVVGAISKFATPEDMTRDCKFLTIA